MATTNEKGTFENPFTITEFESMRTGGTWTGGWVTLSTGDVVYKTSDGTTEQAIGTNALGSQPNPFSLTAFQELSAKGFWQGGYVREANGNVHYYREDSECSICGSGSEFGSDATPSGGSGSGSCGCGCGEGCGNGNILSGYDQVRLGPVLVNFSWEDGTSGNAVPATLDTYTYLDEVKDFSIHVTGEANYIIHIDIKFKYSNDASESQYHVMEYDYSIPESFRV